MRITSYSRLPCELIGVVRGQTISLERRNYWIVLTGTSESLNRSRRATCARECEITSHAVFKTDVTLVPKLWDLEESKLAIIVLSQTLHYYNTGQFYTYEGPGGHGFTFNIPMLQKRMPS